MILLHIYILWVAVGVEPISAGPGVTVSSVRVGSTALLPCKLTNMSSPTPHVRWRTDQVVVFERSSGGTSEGSGYEGRVDVPEGELRKGNCSLVLKNVRITDDSFYKNYVVENMDSANKWNEINRVKVSVDVLELISVPVGSTVLLPCQWRNLSIQTPYVEWNTDRGVVFERSGKESLQGPGYEGRVDVPEDALLKGNCSLVLRNVSGTDAAVYISGMVVKHTSETLLLQKVKLSVYEKTGKSQIETSGLLGEAGINGPVLLILIISLLMSLFFSH